MVLSMMLLSLMACGQGCAEDSDKPGDSSGDSAPTGDSSGDSAPTDDTSADSSTPTDPWEHCPDESAYEGDAAWEGALEILPGATYCSWFQQGRSLQQELDIKSQLRVLEGTWPLPSAEGSHTLTLPTCIRRAAGAALHAMTGSGSTRVEVATQGGSSQWRLLGSQPFGPEGGADRNLHHTITLVAPEGDPPPTLQVDGLAWDIDSAGFAVFNLADAGGSIDGPEAVAYGLCDQTDWQTERHQIAFEGGQIDLELRLGPSVMETGPGAFLRAEGSLDGEAFVQESFFHLIYTPEQDHTRRHFAVIFDAPIAEACSLVVQEVEPSAGGNASVHTADCSLQALEPREVSSTDYQGP